MIKNGRIILIIMNFLLITSCNKKEIVITNFQSLDGDIYVAIWKENKFTQSDFYRDDSNDTIFLDHNNIHRPPKNLKINIIDKLKMNGKSVLQAINELKSNFRIKEQSIYCYNMNDTLRLIGFFQSFEIPNYLGDVDILFYFKEEYNLGDKRSYFRNEILSDSSEIKRISSILANEYKYEILQRTFIPYKE